MLKPSASELMKSKKIDSKYTLVIATAKRAGYRVVAVEDASQAKFVESIKSFGDIYVASMDELIM